MAVESGVEDPHSLPARRGALCREEPVPVREAPWVTGRLVACLTAGGAVPGVKLPGTGRISRTGRTGGADRIARHGVARNTTCGRAGTYKQGVGGSSPSAPTPIERSRQARAGEEPWLGTDAGPCGAVRAGLLTGAELPPGPGVRSASERPASLGDGREACASAEGPGAPRRWVVWLRWPWRAAIWASHLW